MKKTLFGTSVLLIGILLISSCSTEESAPEVMIVEEPVVQSESEFADDSTESVLVKEEQIEKAVADLPAWFSVSLTDVNTGAVFTVEENLGKVILVETLATWCSNCFKQQTEVAKLHGLLGERDDFVSLGVDIDPNEDIPLLTGYVQKNGFDWLYVIASGEMINEISNLYGPQFLNPPSTPMLIIDRDGNAHPLEFGIKSAEELLSAVTPYLKVGT